MSDFDVLIGHTVEAVYVNEDKTALAFLTEVGPLVFVAYGDCCSSTWVEHVTLDFKRGEVTQITYPEMPDDPNDDRDEVVSCYGANINIGYRGTIAVEYRNGSNGYYGGNMQYTPGQSADTWKLLTEDF